MSTDGIDVATSAEFRAWPQQFIPIREKPNRGEFVTVTSDGVVTMMEISSTKCSHTHGAIYVARDSLVNLTGRSLERNREVMITYRETSPMYICNTVEVKCNFTRASPAGEDRGEDFARRWEKSPGLGWVSGKKS